MSESHEALRVRIEVALRERWPDARVSVRPPMEDRYGGHDAMAVATWGNVEVLASGEDEQTALGEVADAVCLELREHADHLDALLARQRAILTGVANALRGDPGPLASHSHHDLAERAAAAVAEAAQMRDIIEGRTTGERLTTCDELARLSREVVTVRAAYAIDLDGLRAEVRRADDERDVRRTEAARLTAERDAAHAAIAGLREEISDAADTLHRLYLRAAQIVAAVGDPAAARMEPMTPSALDAACAAEDRATADEPLLDGTDGAHPAWWRGHDRAAEMLTAQRDAALAACGEQSAEDGVVIQRFGAALNAAVARAETAEREVARLTRERDEARAAMVAP